MELLEIITLAIIQGVTEWLPVSSSGHLVIAEHVLNLEADVFYNVLLHIGSLLVVIHIFRRDILELLKVFINKAGGEYKSLLAYLIIGTVPIAIIGLLFEKALEAISGSLITVGVSLLVTGLALYPTRWAVQNKRLGWGKALVIGAAQAIAIVPGISRSGMTISTALLLGINREKAVRFSFLLFIPAISGALILQLKNFSYKGGIGVMILGVTLTMAVSYIVILYLLRLIKHKRFYLFAYYCWMLGLLLTGLAIKNGL